jgi:hypothetical protein
MKGGATPAKGFVQTCPVGEHQPQQKPAAQEGANQGGGRENILIVNIKAIGHFGLLSVLRSFIS